MTRADEASNFVSYDMIAFLDRKGAGAWSAIPNTATPAPLTCPPVVPRS